MDETYSDFADVYDELMDNIPYEEWYTYLHSLLLENNISDGIVAELGCGTGTMTELLAASGYDMIGIDLSPSMLELANAKKRENNSSALYLCQDMRSFELYGTVAAIISICDSINYITSDEDLLQTFRLVNNYLDPNGLFIFDFNTKHYYRDVVADATIAEDRDDTSFIWDNFYNDEDDINELLLSLFIRVDEENQLFKKHQELHLQKGYTLATVKALISESGLVLENAYDAFTKNEATEDSERIYIIARENGK